MVASQSFDGHDRPSAQNPRCPQDGIFRLAVQLVAEAIQQLHLRAAEWAGVWLGVEAAVRGVVVLVLALGAHLEACHRGHGPVVGYRAGYGEAWPAVRAVGERVAVAPVRGVEDLRQALLA